MKKLISIIMALISSFAFAITVNAKQVVYTDMNVPSINSSFKTWMDYRMCAWGSAQRNFSETWGWVDGEGFMRCNGERDFGIDQDYYLVAMGSYYGKTIGMKYRITTDTGRVFYVALAEFKADRDTNSTHQYCPGNKDILEFLVKADVLNHEVKRAGSANVYMPLNGSIIKIEEMSFIFGR